MIHALLEPLHELHVAAENLVGGIVEDQEVVLSIQNLLWMLRIRHKHNKRQRFFPQSLRTPHKIIPAP